MTIDEIKKWMLESSGFPVTQANAEYLERFQAIAFKAGAASRDAAIERYDVALLQVRKALCGDIHNTDDLLDLIERLQSERDQLRAQINVLREVLSKMHDTYFKTDEDEELCKMALASIPEQSLAAYRNKVIEECAAKCKDKHVNGNWMYDYREECEAAILNMKEQP